LSIVDPGVNALGNTTVQHVSGSNSRLLDELQPNGSVTVSVIKLCVCSTLPYIVELFVLSKEC